MPGEDVLPPGPLRTLTEAIHEIYDASGRPSLAMIEGQVRKRDRKGSRESIGMVLRGTSKTKWATLRPIVVALAEMSVPARSGEAETAKIKHLWDLVSETGAPVEQLPDQDPGDTNRVHSVFVLGGVSGETDWKDYEEPILAQFCREMGKHIADSGTDLVVCSPFPDSADFYALAGYFESPRRDGTAHMHMPRSDRVSEQFSQMLQLLGSDAADRIKVWHYPGPEVEGAEAAAQAWVLCQLMAMEEADVVVAVGGKPDKTANTILHLAAARHKPLVPFTFLEGAAARAFKRRDWTHVSPRSMSRPLPHGTRQARQ
ncbi:hypothetical protein [Labedaea rhizosphaerae]|uniref:Uncharacterized protein n=1 Tax=Labedaea rhizosphaerae TaxID=598644 RepID=A0A4R6SPB4_LABRH|nr:hypothetical protein [Labedaea rhizosphaerae]TDQ05844.1 hypothetical protein EV186_1011822 [Labedaea rhizosphaerae]